MKTLINACCAVAITIIAGQASAQKTFGAPVPKLAYFASAAADCVGHEEGRRHHQQLTNPQWLKNTHSGATLGKGPGIYYAGKAGSVTLRSGRCQVRTLLGALEPAQIRYVKLQVTDHSRAQGVQASLCFINASGTRHCGLPAATTSRELSSSRWLRLDPPAGSFNTLFRAEVEFSVPSPALGAGPVFIGGPSTTSKFSGIHSIQVYKK